MDSITLVKNFDVNKVAFGSVKNLDSGGRSVYIGYEGHPLIIQTPEMIAPFGITKWVSDGKMGDKITMELSFKGKEDRDVLQKFYDMLMTLDDKFVEDALDNSMSWLKKKYTSKEVVQALYTPMVKFPKDKNTGEITDKYPPTFRVTLPYKDNNLQCEVYDKSRNRMDLLAMENTKGCRMTAICQATGIWVAGGKFGCSWKVLQLLCIPPNSIKGFAFAVDDSDPGVVSKGTDDESPMLSDEETAAAVPDDTTTAQTETIDDEEAGDDDIVDEDEDEIDKPKSKSKGKKSVSKK
jgi:hypothetical protein